MPDDELLVAYGFIACGQLEVGHVPQDINFISDPDSSADSIAANTRAVIAAAGSALCPQAVED